MITPRYLTNARHGISSPTILKFHSGSLLLYHKASHLSGENLRPSCIALLSIFFSAVVNCLYNMSSPMGPSLQGSILGPLLLLIYIKDVASVSSKLYYVLFADDTNVFISGNNLRKLINTLHIELNILYAWLQSNKLTLNLLKIHYMVYHRAKHKHMDVKLCINKVPIQQVDNTNFLGVIIDDNLNWSNHISYINS